MTATIHHGILPGAIGRIIELHGAYYSALAGFGVFFSEGRSGARRLL